MSTKIISKFYGGMTRDEKSKSIGVSSNVEELDIFENADFVRPTQVMSSDAMPAGTEVYSYTSDNADSVFGLGKETSGGKVRIVSVANGGSSNPGSFSTLFTAASVLSYKISPIEYHRCSSGDTNRLYWISANGSTISLNHCTTSGTNETSDGQLTGLDSTFDRLFMRKIYGELHIGNGQYITRVDKDGAFTEKAFTLPNGWEAVDICEAGNSALILARNINRNANITKGFFWDLSSTTAFDDSFDIPFGGPQWLIKHRETIKIMCAINGEARFYKVSAYAGGVPAQLKGMVLKNVAIESDTYPISSSNMVSVKDDVIYFGVHKTDKTAIYAIGQIENSKDEALCLAKRFSSTNYASHVPNSVYILGPNFYGAYKDGSTASNSRCETLNNPDRSSQAVYESIIIDDDNSTSKKKITEIGVVTKPINSGCAIQAFIDPNGEGYDEIFQPDGSLMDIANQHVAVFEPKAEAMYFKIKIAFTSNGTDSPYLLGVFYTALQQNSTAKAQ